MNPGEYDVMAQVEASHWWYRGLRDSVQSVLSGRQLQLPDRPRVLDAGCGTGENLRFLSELLAPSYLGGFDHSGEALDLAKKKAPTAELYRSDICDPEIRADDLDLVISLDVIYIPGVERALGGLKQLIGALRPGGLFLVNLPAYDWLYSEHDVAIHTSERYTKRRVRQLLEQLGLSVIVLSYRLCVLFPVVLLSRLPGMVRAKPGDASGRSDLHSIPGPLTSRLCYGAVSFENKFIARGLSLPFGSSVFAVGRKP